MTLDKLEWTINQLANTTVFGEQERQALKEARDILAAVHGALNLNHKAEHKDVVNAIWKVKVDL